MRRSTPSLFAALPSAFLVAGLLASGGVAPAAEASTCETIVDRPAVDDGIVDRLRGEWRGDVPLPGGLAIQVTVDGTEDAPAVLLTIPKLGVFASPPRSATIAGGVLVLQIAAVGMLVEVRLDAATPVSATVGFPAGPPQVTAIPPATAELVPVPPIRSLPGASRHDGMLELPGGGRLPITVVLATLDGVDHGLVDIPSQGVQGLVLVPGAAEDGSTRWILPVPSPAELLLTPRGDSWDGRFTQGPLTLDVTFERAAAGATLDSRRPQDPIQPWPYETFEVEVPTPGGHVLAGTVVIPGTAPPDAGFPAVVLVTGSGPQNRDEEIMGHRPFLVLADHLARLGIASLRYDDRGIAGSTGVFDGATSFDFADDAAAALRFLQRYPAIDCERTGLAGHSEGGAVVAIVAAGMAPVAPEVTPAFLVSIAGCGVSGDRVLADQLARIYRAGGVDEAEIAEIARRQAVVLAAMKSEDADPEAFAAAMRSLQDAQLALQGGEIDDGVRASLEAAGRAEMMSPWMRTFVRFDPAEAFSKVDVPVLAVNGTLDLQVWHDLNLPAIESAIRAGGGSVEVVRLEGLNHMLQPATTGGVDEYGVIDITMDEHAMDVIGEWILAAPSRSSRPSHEVGTP